MSQKRGFTLIELLVVIAIIAVLAGIVMAAVNSARSKGNIAAVKGNMNAIRQQAELYYDDTGAYGAAYALGACSSAGATTMFASTTISAAWAAANSAGNGTAQCVSTGQAYAVSIGFRGNSSNNDWCIDSTGYAGAKAANAAGNCQ